MKRTLIRCAALFVLLCAARYAPALTTVTTDASKWSGGNSLNTRINEAKAGEETIIRVTQNLTVDNSINIKSPSGSSIKRIIITSSITSSSPSPKTLTNRGNMHAITVNPGVTLILSNIVYDCKNASRSKDLFHLAAADDDSTTTRKVSRMILEKGAIVKNANLTTATDKENAVFHVKSGAVLTIRDGASILNCKNTSNPGKGGAICCDFGTIVMTGGTIAGCTARGDGGAIHTDGTRVESHDNYGINARGDIYISGGYITNNTCGAGMNGGGIYLGNSGPLLHITGTAVISNNFCGTGNDKIADDVSTYQLNSGYVNRLKLVDYHESHPEGFTYAGELFTGWVGVRYPDKAQTPEPQQKQFGAIWEYFNGNQEEARQFFWNGDNAYRGKMVGNSLVWTKHFVHELPKDGLKVVELIEQEQSPIYMELSSNYKMEQAANVPPGIELFIDLKGYDLECDFHISNDTARVTIMDSSTNKSGTVTGHRDSTYPNAFYLEGGSYHTLPKPEWVASNCVVIGNYCENHPYMVAIKVWDAKHEQVVTDMTGVKLEQAHTEVRTVEKKADGTYDIGNITFSTGDWKFMQYTNANYRAQVLAGPAVEDSSGFREIDPRMRIKLFDTHGSHDDEPLGEGSADAGQNFGREDEFEWDEQSYGLVKLIHITMEKSGQGYVNKNTQVAYFRFPDAEFLATQRKNGNNLPIAVVDALLTCLGYNRAYGSSEDQVNAALNRFEANGLRKWENIVTGTDTNQLLLSTAGSGENDLSLNIALADAHKVARTDTLYTVKYDIRKSTGNGWERVGEIKDEPSFSVPLLDANGASVGASGFYRVTTLIIPDEHLAITNEIPSTNIVGVLEVASTLTNTLAAVPWVALAGDPFASAAAPMSVAGYVHTPQLNDGDSVQVADKGYIYRQWSWKKNAKEWEGSTTVTSSGVYPETLASEHTLSRSNAVWVKRRDPAAKPFFLIGQYSSAMQTLRIAAGTTAGATCTLVANPTFTAKKINDYNWGNNPIEGDLIRIPNEKAAPQVLRWKNGQWGRLAGGEWKTDTEVPAGTGFWYMRKGDTEFELELPFSAPQTQESLGK